MANITQVKSRPSETLQRLEFSIYEQARADNLSLTEMLRRADPDEDYKGDEARIGPIGRILDVADIRTRSFPDRGLFASTYQQWHNDKRAQVLLPEWIVRTFQNALTTHRRQQAEQTEGMVRAFLGSQDDKIGGVLRPYFDRPGVAWDTLVVPAIPLSELIADEQAVTGDTYRVTRFTRNAADLRTARVVEGTEVPRFKVATSDYVNKLYKYGIGVEWTYEAIRRLPLDKVARIVAEIAVQQEVDKVSAAADVLYNGDGSPNSAAAITNLTTLDSTATPPNITLKAWIAFKMLFAQPYSMSTALATSASMQQLMLLNTGSANVPLVVIAAQSGFGGFSQINEGLRDNVAIGWTSDIPASKILAFDRTRALERAFEANSIIREVERFVTRQTEVLVLTENEAFCVLDPNAALVLNLAA